MSFNDATRLAEERIVVLEGSTKEILQTRQREKINTTELLRTVR